MADRLPPSPTAQETARRDVAPYRDMTPAQRWEVWKSVQADASRFLRGRTPVEAPEDPPFWRRWRDPSLGRPA